MEKTFSQAVKDEIRTKKLRSPKECMDILRGCFDDKENTFDISDREKRDILRALFVETGSVTDPDKSYHLEIIPPAQGDEALIKALMDEYNLNPKITTRSGNRLVYMKEGSCIVDFLGLVGASLSLMDMENKRILKEMRGNINRRVNCETANIAKTASASARQIEDIKYIRDHGGFGHLEERLAEMARVRLDNPDASLTELGGLVDPPIGKSGVNHRLRKLSKIADDMRM